MRRALCGELAIVLVPALYCFEMRSNAFKNEHAHKKQAEGKNRKPRSLPMRIVRAVILVVLIAHLAYIGITSILMFVYKFANPPTTVLMMYRSIISHWNVQKPIPLALSNIPLSVRRMLVSVEDGKFYEHHGIDMEAFKRARALNEKIGKPMYGGSTITMQVARTLFLVPDKSYIRKYLEVIAALEMEFILSKNRILELYFGYAEWGKGIFGIERASRVYYGTSVRNISADQAARLIALLSSPIKYTPDTLYRSLILRERYAYLVQKYISPIAETKSEAETPPPAGIEPSADMDPEADVSAQVESAGPLPDTGGQVGNAGPLPATIVPAEPGAPEAPTGDRP